MGALRCAGERKWLCAVLLVACVAAALVGTATAAFNNTLFVCGAFTSVNGVAANSIAQWDGTTWRPLGTGYVATGSSYSAGIAAMAVNGSTLYVGGEFTAIGGVSASHVASWNGSAWAAMSTGLDNAVIDMTFHTTYDGLLYAVGTFTGKVAKWSGSSWSTVGTVNGDIGSVVSFGGQLFVAQWYYSSSTYMTSPSTFIAMWDGSSWSTTFAAISSSTYKMAGASFGTYNGSLFMQGGFTTLGYTGQIAANRIAQYLGIGSGGGGTSGLWQAMGTGMNAWFPDSFGHMVEYNGLLYVGGSAYNTYNGTLLTLGGLSGLIATWNLATWALAANNNLTVVYGAQAMSVYNGLLVVGDVVPNTPKTATMSTYNGVNQTSIATFSSTTGFPNLIKRSVAMVSCPVGGLSYGVNCVSCGCVNCACSDGTAGTGSFTCNTGSTGGDCSVCQSGYFGSSCTACTLCTPHGTCYQGASGNCTCNTGWAGSTCSACATGYYGPSCAACACTVNGTCADSISGSGVCTCAAGWAGATCAVCANGYTGASCIQNTTVTLYVAGAFTSAGNVTANSVAQYNGTAWSGLGTGFVPTSQGIYSVVAIGQTLYAGGEFTAIGGVSANRVASWNGVAWSAMSTGSGATVVLLIVHTTGDGSLYAISASGGFVGFVAKWSGSSWGTLGGVGMSQQPVNAISYNGLLLFGASPGSPQITYGGISCYGSIRCVGAWNSTSNAWSIFLDGTSVSTGLDGAYAFEIYASKLFMAPFNGTVKTECVLPYGLTTTSSVFSYNGYDGIGSANPSGCAQRALVTPAGAGFTGGTGVTLALRSSGYFRAYNGRLYLAAISGATVGESYSFGYFDGATWNNVPGSSILKGHATVMSLYKTYLTVGDSTSSGRLFAAFYLFDGTNWTFLGNFTIGSSTTYILKSSTTITTCAVGSFNYGASCTPCPVNCAACFDGLAGNGSCSSCHAGATGATCATCSSGYYGTYCAGCPSCGAQGTCSDGAGGSGTCSCATGWTGALCDSCSSGYYGASCTACPACVNGTCNQGLAGNGSCSCASGFTGTLCDACVSGRYGASCTACPSCGSHGTCNSGITGNGTCSCASAWTGTLCTACKSGRYGSSCTACPSCSHGTCNQGVSGNGTCSCTLGWSGSLCNACASGRYGASCSACPSCVLGTCNQGLSGNGTCSCQLGATGSLCDTCLSGYYGASCTACPACVLGTCLDGVARDGTCSCQTGATGALCNACVSGYYGPSCVPCPSMYGVGCSDGVSGDGTYASCVGGWSGPYCNVSSSHFALASISPHAVSRYPYAINALFYGAGQAVAVSGLGVVYLYNCVSGDPPFCSYLFSVTYGGSSSDNFGAALAMSGSPQLLIVGAPGYGSGAGAVFVYDCDFFGATCSLVRPLYQTTQFSATGFGTSIAVDQSLVVVGSSTWAAISGGVDFLVCNSGDSFCTQSGGVFSGSGAALNLGSKVAVSADSMRSNTWIVTAGGDGGSPGTGAIGACHVINNLAFCSFTTGDSHSQFVQSGDGNAPDFGVATGTQDVYTFFTTSNYGGSGNGGIFFFYCDYLFQDSPDEYGSYTYTPGSSCSMDGGVILMDDPDRPANHFGTLGALTEDMLVSAGSVYGTVLTFAYAFNIYSASYSPGLVSSLDVSDVGGISALAASGPWVTWGFGHTSKVYAAYCPGGTCACQPNWGNANCDDCESNHYSEDCSLPCPPCHQGFCHSGLSGDGACLCNHGWTGTLCDACYAGSYGPTCAQCTCSEHGHCSDGILGDGSCACDAGWVGATCDTCDTGYYGASCTQCPCAFGTCSDGLLGDGSCTCDVGWVDGVCDQCGVGYYGPSCTQCICSHGACNDGLAGTGDCTCDVGWAGLLCDTCDFGFYGASCTTCPVCGIHGRCSDGISGDGACVCSDGWTGEVCDTCLPHYFGSSCTPCANYHGVCDDGLTGSGLYLSCDAGWSGDYCEISGSHFALGQLNQVDLLFPNAMSAVAVVNDQILGIAVSGLNIVYIYICFYHGPTTLPVPECELLLNVSYSGADSDQFGAAVAFGIFPEMLVVGAPGYDSGAGAVFVYDCDFNTACTLVRPMYQTTQTGNAAGFGTSVAVMGALVAVGSESWSLSYGGIDYLVCNPGDTFCYQSGFTLTPPVIRRSLSSHIGSKVALSADTLRSGTFIMTLGGDEGSSPSYGIIQSCSVIENVVFCSATSDLYSDTWVQSGDTLANIFGYQTDTADVYAVFSSPLFNGTSNGAIYLFYCSALSNGEEEYSQYTYTPTDTCAVDSVVRVDDSETPGNYFGAYAAVTDDILVGSGFVYGTVWVFSYNSSVDTESSAPVLRSRIDVNDNGISALAAKGPWVAWGFESSKTVYIAYCPDSCACLPGWAGDACDVCDASSYGPNCTEHCLCGAGGVCDAGFTGTGACTCNSGWSGELCDTCLPAYYGPECLGCTCINGICDDGINGTGICSCYPGWVGSACDACDTNLFGPECSPCDCVFGACNDGVGGDGACTCSSGYFGSSCSLSCGCVNGPSCFDGVSGDGTCTSCNDGWYGIYCDAPCTCDPTGGTACNNLQPAGDGHCVSCNPGYWNPDCSVACTCGHGSCNDGTTGTGACTCDAGWVQFGHGRRDIERRVPAGCWICDADYWGSDCTPCSCPPNTVCSDGNGGDGSCPCATGWATVGLEGVCDVCAAGYYGSSCSPCSCETNSVCFDGNGGDGSCACVTGWANDGSGGLCNVCDSGYYGSSCTPCSCGSGQSCHDSISGDGSCYCPSGYYGSSCAACPSCLHGSCNDGIGGSGTCSCDAHWTSALCDACVSGYYGSSCSACPSCVHGVCNDGVAGSGTCACDAHWTNSLCSACDSGYYGPSCTACACTIEGTCHDGVGGDGACNCVSGWAGPTCDSCAFNHYGESCASCPSCLSGTCNMGLPGNGTCSCSLGWSGTLCDVCASGYYGAPCTACPSCVHGSCNDGISRNGTCSCATGWSGALCDTCAAGYYGDSCTPCPSCGHGTCNSGSSANGTCSCESHWTGSGCDGCVPGFYGSSCTACPSCVSGVCDDGTGGVGGCFCDSGWTGTTCNACVAGFYGGTCAPCSACVHGSCLDGVSGSGECACSDGWTGTSCNTCLPGYFGISCTQCPVCSHGSCSDTLEGTGACICDPGWAGSNCDILITSSPTTAVPTTPAPTTAVPTTAIPTTPASTDRPTHSPSPGPTTPAPPTPVPTSCPCVHGTCSGSSCICNTGWTGTLCDSCDVGYYGLSCAPCNCGIHGSCDDGLFATGMCSCNAGFVGTSCDSCAANRYGPNCRPCQCQNGATCNSGIAGNGSCVCQAGFAGTSCSSCAANYYGHSCLPCGCVNGGLCNATINGDGGCSCPSNYQGPTCNACTNGYYGPSCNACIDNCGAHGLCDDGVSGSGTCICSLGWVGTFCDSHTNSQNSTSSPTTPAPTTPIPTTAAPTTPTPTTAAPTTPTPTTAAPTTPVPTTHRPTTPAPTTPAPTTPPPPNGCVNTRRRRNRRRA